MQITHTSLEHKKKITLNDNFFIVKGLINNNTSCFIAYIAKSFVSEDFDKKIPKTIKFKTIEVLQLKDQNEFEQYKIDNK
jgi:hypothetical protein